MTTQDRSPLVLVADDEINTTIMLQHIFEREGYRVMRVTNGLDALRAAQEAHPDLILLDILMPGMNGFDVLQQLRENVVTASIPTIMITANAREPADVARGLNLGADDYLYKPFAPQELLARAQSKIRARQLEDALQRRSNELEALLNASEKLNQHLEPNELLRLVVELAGRLLPGDLIASCRFESDGRIIDWSYLPDQVLEWIGEACLHDALTWLAQTARTIQWHASEQFIPGYYGGLAAPLHHGQHLVGALIIARKKDSFDENDRRLFEGFARHAALALRNAQLYELQTQYANHLEDMVAERTRELESAQKLLIRSEKLASIGHLAASIAHEINNPLMPIRNLIEEIIDDLEQRSVSYDKRAVEIIQESLERIRGIVSRLLEFARDSGPDMQLVDISELLEGIITLNRKFFQHERIEVLADLPPLPPIYGSKEQLNQVFMNLALNAQAAMAGGGTLRISARQEGSMIVVEFEDNGCGIPPEQIDRIFDPFFSTKPNGTGLGLFVSHGIIQGHHGLIEVESTPGTATRFRVYLPIHTDV